MSETNKLNLIRGQEGLSAVSKDLHQVQETWKFFFLTHIQFCEL